jgi:hypothetical protein
MNNDDAYSVFVPQLTATNYIAWKSAIMISARSSRLVDYVTKTEALSPAHENDEKMVAKYWKMSAIITATATSLLSHLVVRNDTSDETWHYPLNILKRIEGHFNPDGHQSRFKHKMDFFNIQMMHGETCAQLRSRIDQLANDTNRILRTSGHTKSTNNVMDLIAIHKLVNDSAEMSKLVTAVRAIIPLRVIEPLYLEYEKWEKATGKTSTTQSSSSSTSQTTPSGHTDDESWAGEIGPDDKLCVFMSAIAPIFPFEHKFLGTIKDLTYDYAVRYTSEQQSKGEHHESLRSIQTPATHHHLHMENDCPLHPGLHPKKMCRALKKREKDKERKKKKLAALKAAAPTLSTPSASPNANPHANVQHRKLFMIRSTTHNVSPSSSHSSTYFAMIDSGDSACIIPHDMKHLLTNYHEVTAIPFSLANGNSILATGIGELKMKVNNSVVIIQECFTSREVKDMYISVGALDKAGYTTSFGGGQCSILQGTTVITTFKRSTSDSLYYLPFQKHSGLRITPIRSKKEEKMEETDEQSTSVVYVSTTSTSDTPIPETTTSITSTPDISSSTSSSSSISSRSQKKKEKKEKKYKIMELHVTLGHLNAPALLRAIKASNFQDISIEEVERAVERCEACCTMKSKRSPSKEQSTTNLTKPLELLQVDRSGPHTPTFSGNTSYQVIIDRFTGYKHVDIDSTKANASQQIIDFVNAAEVLHQPLKTKAIRTDGAAEYNSAKYRTFLKERGISKQTSGPYR